MKHFSDKEEKEGGGGGGGEVEGGLYSTDGFLLPQSWNSSRRVWPFISARLPLLLCHIFPSLPHQNPSESLMQKSTDCAGAGGHTLAAPLHFSNPWRCWCPKGLNLRRRAVKTGHLDPTSIIRPTCGAREKRKAELPPPTKPRLLPPLPPPPLTGVASFLRG